jgi:hypothetical protein
MEKLEIEVFHSNHPEALLRSQMFKHLIETELGKVTQCDIGQVRDCIQRYAKKL